MNSCYTKVMIKFSGTRAEFGKYRGELLLANQHNFYADYDVATLREQLKIYQKYYPEFVEECLQIAETVHKDPNIVLYEEIAAFVDSQRKKVGARTHGCTVFAVVENGKTFVGRNYDWWPQAREFFGQYDIGIKGTNRYFAFTDEGVWDRHFGRRSRTFYVEDGINEHGLYVGLTAADLNKWNYGLRSSHLIRYIMEHCKTTRQALNVFRRIPAAIPKNFLIADPSGDVAVVEDYTRGIEVLRPDTQGVIVHTNHALTPKTIKMDHVLKDNLTATSFVRYAEARYLIARQLPNFQFTDIWRILRESHYVYNQETIWSLALELSEPRYNIYCDTAMGQKQQKFGF